MRSPGRPKMLSTSAEPSPVLPNRHLGVELGCLSHAQHDVAVPEDEPHAAGQHVQPLEAVVGARSRPGLSPRDHDLPRLDAARPGQREDGASVDPARLEADAGVADLRGSDQVVDRHPVHLRQRKQQLEARATLSVLEAREGALRDAGMSGRDGQGQATLGADLSQPRADEVQRRRNA
jgi:hypothetical protein